MNKYRKALFNLSLLEREYVFKTTNQFAPLVWTDRLEELVEKATPKKPDYVDIRPRWHSPNVFYDYTIDKCYRCPTCNSRIFHVWKDDIYCPKCGQKIDWSEEE